MRRTLALPIALVVALALAGGCSDGGSEGVGDTTVAGDTVGGDTTAPPEDTGGEADTADTSAPADTRDPDVVTKTVNIGPFSVPSGVERTMCATIDLGNDAGATIRGIRTHLTPGSHHMIVHRLDGPADPTPRPCGAFSHGMNQQVLFIAQQRESELVYPDGAGLPVPAHQSIGLELHYINYFAEDDVDITGSVDIDLGPPTAGEKTIQVLFTGELSFMIPANGEKTVTSYTPIPSSWQILAMTSHTHQLGVLATIAQVSGPSDATPEVLHESTSWSEPPLTTFDPPLVLDKGGLELTCEFENTTDHPVYFGTGFNDEMCFMWLYYVAP
ncbi:MAG: hypothetical protein H6745_15275 [Deltaproteobacteria bacterium]|nr:hypothetical protein [Deltaproteobacteria bacterium]